ncbi:AAA ATPase domain-containing protein [Nocardioides sp. YR527]|uniref:helix-turn-helix transcriptional regulator n=1 Tax=Nocardioides sp. YR527 TaxID=1881028 RepID=UPI000880000E|nr:LuxR family transcriptional regulator [Nocardioides sp. YR527]SDJ85136.1 AAA ATPase domain-containing protein [Nocardioides sp. YR527]
MARPGRLAAAPALVGRSAELALLVGSLADPPTVAFIEGEAGIGKSRLVRECLQAPDLADRRVLMVTCPPMIEPFPLGPVVDGLRRLRPGLGDLELSPLAGALRPLFPEWAARLPPAPEPLDDPAETRHRLLAALSELVDRLGVDVMVVEDAHWADAATLEWLLLTASGHLETSVVVTYRATEVPPGSLLLRLTSRPLTAARVRIELTPLTIADTRELVGSMLETDAVSEQFAVVLHERTDGLPLAVEETIWMLRDRHDIVRQDGGWTRGALEGLNVPPTLRDSVLERAGRLPPEGRMVLQAAAILAEPTDEALLTGVADLDEPAARRGVAAALGSGLLREAGNGWLAFRHVLDALAIGAAIPASERWALHRRAADRLLRQEPQPVVRLAHHFHEAGETEQWSHYAEAAAELALESGDERTAVTLLHELLTSIAHPPVRRVRLARRLGDVAVNRLTPLGGMESVVQETLAGILADPDVTDVPEAERGEVRLLLGWMQFQAGEFEAGHAEFETAVGELRSRPARAARAMLFLADPESKRSWPAERHLQWMEQATRLIPQIQSPAERRALSLDRVTGLLSLGEETGWRAAEEIPRSADTLGERRQLVKVVFNVAHRAVHWGRYAEARRRLEEAAESAHHAGFERVGEYARFHIALLDWYTGRWDGLAETLSVMGDDEETHPLLRLAASSVRAMQEVAVGNRDAAERRSRQVLEHATGTLDDPTTLSAVALGRLLLADGAVQEAVRVTAAPMEAIRRKGIWLQASDVAPVHVDALVADGELSRATDVVDDFATWTAGRAAPAADAALLTCRAILAEANGDLVVAADLFADAALAWADLPRPYDELLALERHGRCLLAAREHDQGVQVLSDAQQRLAGLGVRWDADRVARVLRQHGVEVTRTWRRGRRGYGEQLSPREVEVIQLVARGMTNKEVAATLFISPRTVHRHLSSAMRKLEVSSRTALAMAASAAGMLASESGR